MTEPLRRSAGDLTNDPRTASAIASIRQRSQRTELNLSASDLEAFRCEGGSQRNKSADRAALKGNILLENPESETRWYFKYFLGHAHQNYITGYLLGNQTQYAVLSVVVEAHSQAGTAVPQCRAICWRLTGSERIVFPLPKGQKQAPEPKALFAQFGLACKKAEEIINPDVQQDLLTLEEQEGAVNFKIGVLYAKGGQRSDDEMFSNEHGSEAFNEFCSLLGKKVLQSELGDFRGGLDVRNGSTGKWCHQSVEYGKEILFHVSTLLPYSHDNPQQLERKRHLGNDICNIVYQEDPGTPFFPEMIKSQFNHIFVLVSKTASGNYTLKVYSKNSVPEYGPALPNPPEFDDPLEFRHFLLTKLLNGEKAALNSPNASFAIKRRRTLAALLSELNDKYIAVGKGRATTFRSKSLRLSPAKSSPLRLSPRSSKRTTSSEAFFREYGQSIKIGKIAASSAPTSTLSGSNALKTIEPWAPVCISTEFPHQVFCGDSWNSDVVVGTADGVYRVTVAIHVTGDLAMTQLVDSSVQVVQLFVEATSGLMFLRTAKSGEEEDLSKMRRATMKDAGRGSSVYCLPLDTFGSQVINRKTIKQYEIKQCKGTHTIAVASSASGQEPVCLLAAAFGKKLRTYQIKADTATTAAAVEVEAQHECSCGDTIVTLSFPTEGDLSRSEICVSQSNGRFELIDLPLATPQQLLMAEATVDVEPIAFEQVAAENDTTDFMITYNQLTVFLDREGNPTRPFDVKWNSRLSSVVYLYPYILGFSSDSVEIVTLINGNLVKNVPFAGVRFFSSRQDVFFSTCELADKTALYKMSREGLSGRSIESEFSKLPRHFSGRKMSTGTTGFQKKSRFVRRRSSSDPASPTPSAIAEE